MPDYIVESCQLMHDKKTYPIGSTVKMKAEQAANLIALGVIVPAGVAGGGGNLDQFVQEKIIAAINQLDKNNSELWTKGGLPQTAAIEDVLGINISASERDAAWAAMS